MGNINPVCWTQVACGRLNEGPLRVAHARVDLQVHRIARRHGDEDRICCSFKTERYRPQTASNHSIPEFRWCVCVCVCVESGVVTVYRGLFVETFFRDCAPSQSDGPSFSCVGSFDLSESGLERTEIRVLKMQTDIYCGRQARAALRARRPSTTGRENQTPKPSTCPPATPSTPPLSSPTRNCTRDLCLS